ncbi:Cap-specific mRNA (nucleoside-2'-O-)-methyltransferase 1 [Formica fusca]
MNRRHLEVLTYEELQEEARLYDLPMSDSKDVLIDTIMTHLEENRRLADLDLWSNDNRELRANRVHELSNREESASLKTMESTMMNMFEQMMAQMTQMTMQQQQFMQQVSDSITQAISHIPVLPKGRNPSSPAHASLYVHGIDDSLRHTTISTFTPSNAVSLLASQIPEFGGETDENVQQWIKRVEIVAQAHKVTDDIILLVATSKLTKSAKKWFDMQSDPVLVSWAACRLALLKTFEQKIPFCIAMQKIEARKWMPYKESFRKYAIDKQALIYALGLSPQNTINLLIDGITNISLKSMAMVLPSLTVEQFVNHMSKVSMTVDLFEKKSTESYKSDKMKGNNCKICGKKGHNNKDCKDNVLTCFHCKRKDHWNMDCPKLKKKNQHQEAFNSSTVSSKNKNDSPTSPVVVSEMEPEAEISQAPVSTVAVPTEPSCDIDNGVLRGSDADQAKTSGYTKEMPKLLEYTDKTRVRPQIVRLQNKIQEILNGFEYFFALEAQKLENANVKSILNQPYNWYCMPCGSGPCVEEDKVATFYLGLGRRKVFRYMKGGEWELIEDIKIYLSPDTLVYAELVYETKWTGKYFSKTRALHILDAYMLGGADVSKRYLDDRYKLTKLFCESLQKSVPNDYICVRVKERFMLNPDIGKNLRVAQRRVEMPIAFESRESLLERDDKNDKEPIYFAYNSVLFLKSIAQPWSRHISKKTDEFYVYNPLTKVAEYEIRNNQHNRPPEAEADFKEAFETRIIWHWPGNSLALNMDTLVAMINSSQNV